MVTTAGPRLDDRELRCREQSHRGSSVGFSWQGLELVRPLGWEVSMTSIHWSR